MRIIEDRRSSRNATTRPITYAIVGLQQHVLIVSNDRKHCTQFKVGEANTGKHDMRYKINKETPHAVHNEMELVGM